MSTPPDTAWMPAAPEARAPASPSCGLQCPVPAVVRMAHVYARCQSAVCPPHCSSVHSAARRRRRRRAASHVRLVQASRRLAWVPEPTRRHGCDVIAPRAGCSFTSAHGRHASCGRHPSRVTRSRASPARPLASRDPGRQCTYARQAVLQPCHVRRASRTVRGVAQIRTEHRAPSAERRARNVARHAQPSQCCWPQPGSPAAPARVMRDA